MRDPNASPPPGRDPREEGAALFVVVVSIVMAAALSISLLLVASGHHAATQARLKMEQTFAIAEAGLDRAIAEANKPANKISDTWPPAAMAIATSPANIVRDVNGNQIGFFVVTITDGLVDGIDNNGNVLWTDDPVNDPKEGNFARVISTGFYGKPLGVYVTPGAPLGTPARAHYECEVALECQVEAVNIMPDIQASVLIDDVSPNIDQSGTQWTIDGRDHDMQTLAYDASGPSLPGLATTDDDWGSSAAVVAAKSGTQILGTPSASTSPAISDNVDVDAIIEWAKETFPPTHQFKSTATSGNVNVPNVFPFGSDPTPTSPGVFDVSYVESQGATLNMGGMSTNQGAGILIVNGPLSLSGAFNFTGIIIVKGEISVNGAGGQTLCGAIIASGSPVINLDVTGTTNLLFSSNAVAQAQRMSKTYVMRSWRQVDVPQ